MCVSVCFCVLQAQQMTMQAIAIQQQMLSSFPPVAPAPQSPPSQYHHTHSHTTSSVSKHTHTYTVLWRCTDTCQHVCRLEIYKYCLALKTHSAVSLSFFFFRPKRAKSRRTSLLLFSGKRVCFTLCVV